MRDRRLLGVGALNFVLSFAVGGMILTTLALLVHDRHTSGPRRSSRANSSERARSA
jgi:hypothetical protein